MAYFALPTRDSTLLLLGNAAPRLPRSSCAAASSSCSLVEASPARPLRVQSRSLFGARSFSSWNPRGGSAFASVEGSVSVEEPAVSVGSEGSAGGEEKAPEAAAAGAGSEAPAAPAKKLQRSNTMQRQPGAARAGREITVTKEQLVPGAVFSGKVRAVQSYGAFVDIGAFTDGLVHISQLSSGYVKEVSDVVSVGQEVSVTVVELNERGGRIALSMREKEGEGEQQGSTRSGGESGAGPGVQEDGGGKPVNRGKIAGRGSTRANGRSSDEKATKLKKGQELKGTVKNIIRNGAFIEFAEAGEEGFLRGSEIKEGGENVAVESLLTVGEEVTVRVLKIERGKAALTMKPQVDVGAINASINPDVGAGGASNPFATFFRSANMVPASRASGGAEEGSPAAQEAGAVEEAAAVAASLGAEEAGGVAETGAVEEAAGGAETGASEEAAPVEEARAAEEPGAVAETAASEEAAPVEEARAAEEPGAVAETAASEEAAPVEEAASENEAAGVSDTRASQELAAVAETSVADEAPADDETASSEAVQKEARAVEESKSEPSQAEEPHSLSLGEIAEGIGNAVHEVEKVVEGAADSLNFGDINGATSGGRLEASPANQAEEPRAEHQPADGSENAAAAVVKDTDAVLEPEPITNIPVVAEQNPATQVKSLAAAP